MCPIIIIFLPITDVANDGVNLLFQSGAPSEITLTNTIYLFYSKINVFLTWNQKQNVEHRVQIQLRNDLL